MISYECKVFPDNFVGGDGGQKHEILLRAMALDKMDDDKYCTIEPPHYKSMWSTVHWQLLQYRPLGWHEQESKCKWKMKIFKAKKEKCEIFIMEKLKETTSKKQELKDEPCEYKHKSKGKSTIIKSDKENKDNAPLTKAKICFDR
jgi:hypothetical protein